MKLSKLATLLAIVLSAPFIGLASSLELIGTFSHNTITKADAYSAGDAIFFFLGYPLTRIVFAFSSETQLQDGDNWWAIPLLAGLLAFQWIIWAQLIAVFGRTCQSLFSPVFGSGPLLQTTWPDHIVKADGRRFRMRAYRRHDFKSVPHSEPNVHSHNM